VIAPAEPFERQLRFVMAENEAAVAEQESAAPQQGEAETIEAPFQYTVTIEDAGPATKKVHVEIPKDRIATKLAEQYKTLRAQAAVPGFRVGHAPAKLIEKRFGQDVKEEVRRSLISESYAQAVEKNNLQVIGEPEFENAEAIKLPEDGSGIKYSFQVEVQPDITLPDMTHLTVKKPRIDVTDENVQQALSNLREQQGALVPVEDRGVEPKDYLYADVHIKLDGEVVSHQHDAQIIARPGRINGIDVVDLDKELTGLKTGEERTITVKVPETHADEKLRGKEVQIEFKLKDLKKLEPAVIDAEFLADLGFENEQELLDALREQMVERITYDVQQSMREQVSQYLLANVPMQLPSRLSNQQADRVVARRSVDLMMRGVPREQVEANAEKLRSTAKEEAVRELKLYFILQKVAAQQNAEVDESELNGRIAMLAAQRGKRPEKLKQEMSKDGTLSDLYIQMREQKAVDKLLETAAIEEVELQPKPEAESSST
jgi:trigger factor